jgi:hypothetical protein
MVLYGVKERTVDVWEGHNHLEEILSGVLTSDGGVLEFEEEQYLHTLRHNNYTKKMEIEKWFTSSFRMTVIDFIKQREGIGRHGFSSN